MEDACPILEALYKIKSLKVALCTKPTYFNLCLLRNFWGCFFDLEVLFKTTFSFSSDFVSSFFYCSSYLRKFIQLRVKSCHIILVPFLICLFDTHCFITETKAVSASEKKK